MFAESTPITDGIDTKALILEALERMRQRIVANIEASGIKASGRTQESLRVEETDLGGRLVGRPYFQGTEMGRPAGAVPRNFHDIIKQWIIDKGITPTPRPYLTDRPHKYTEEERALNTMAAAVAHNIQVRGFEPWRGGGRVSAPTDDIYSPVLDDEVAKLMETISVAVRAKIENEYHPFTGLRTRQSN